MKFLKSAISIVLIISMLFSISVAFSSCSEDKEKVSMTVGEYLTSLSDKFGMESYQSEEPHVANIGKDNMFFGVVQASYEWNIIDGSELNTEDEISKEFVANTLVKAVGLKDVSDMSSEEIAKYANENGYITFKYRGEKDNNKLVSKTEAEDSLQASFEIFTNRNYGKGESEVKLTDGVKDLTSMEKNSYVKDEDSNKIIIPKSEYEKLAGSKPTKGDVFVMPATDVETISAHRVESVTTEGDNYVITSTDDNISIDEVMQEYSSQGTTEVDFSKAVITDGLGNPVTEVNGTSTQMDVTEKPKVGYLGTDVHTESEEVAKNEYGLSFKTNGITISGSFSKDGVKFTAEGTLYEAGATTISFKKSYSMNNIVVDHKVDGGILGLKYAFAQVSYTTSDESALNFKYKKTGVFAPEYTNGNGKFFTNFKRAILKDSNAKGAKNIKICNFSILGSEVASLRLEVKLVITVSGEISVVITTDNTAGMEVKKGSGIRWIKEQKKDTDFKVKGTFEFGIYVGLGVYLIGDNVNVLSGGVTFSFGITGELTVHIKDDSNRQVDEFSIEGGNDTVADSVLQDLQGLEMNHSEYGKVKLSSDTCIDAKIYWKITVGLNSECIAKKLLKKVETSFSWGGPKKGVFLEWHFENGQRVDSCTRKYSNAPAEITTTEVTTTEENKAASIFKVESYNVDVSLGGTSKAKILELPAGYNGSDIEFSSKDPDIATVSASGDVTGVSVGSTIVTAKTKDGKYKVSWAVSVQ